MYNLNMAINVIISAILVIQSAFALPFNSLVFRIDNEASVFESGDDMYTVIWSTSLPGTGCVTYEYEGEEYKVMTITELREYKADMFTTVFIGNSQTMAVNGKMVTPRGYRNV